MMQLTQIYKVRSMAMLRFVLILLPAFIVALDDGDLHRQEPPFSGFAVEKTHGRCAPGDSGQWSVRKEYSRLFSCRH